MSFTCYACQQPVQWGATVCPHCTRDIRPGGGNPNGYAPQWMDSLGKILIVGLLIYVAINIWDYEPLCSKPADQCVQK